MLNQQEYDRQLYFHIQNHEYEKAKQLMELKPVIVTLPNPAPYVVGGQTVLADVDPYSGNPVLRISVRDMVHAYVGEGWEIRVEQEHWQSQISSSNPYNEKDRDRKIAVHLYKLNDNPLSEVITIREPFFEFPSQEMRTKLGLLKYK